MPGTKPYGPTLEESEEGDGRQPAIPNHRRRRGPRRKLDPKPEPVAGLPKDGDVFRALLAAGQVRESVKLFLYTYLGNFMVMPTLGPLKTWWGETDNPGTGYSSPYSHDTELVQAGYYAVTLSDTKPALN
ncbi:MAG: glycoside hydrolase family 92 protein [Pedosphaera sp.]|nr:glycoside hydrolase family 92 protein [Pedosphaera sp.]